MAGRGGPDCVRAWTRAARAAAERATDREVVVVAAVLEAGSEKAAAHRLGLSHSTVKHHLANARSKVGAETTGQLVWFLDPRLPEPEGPKFRLCLAVRRRRASRGSSRCRPVSAPYRLGYRLPGAGSSRSQPRSATGPPS